MTLEQKARAYDESLKRASNLYKDANEMGNNMTAKTCEIIFPELNEDERIRKTLIEYFNAYPKDYYGELKKSHLLAWLEKQGDQNPAWSEEYEKLTSHIEGWLDILCDYLKDSRPDYIEDVKDVVKHLKSLRPQNE